MKKMTQLVKWEAAKKAVAEAKSVDEVKDIRDKVLALQLYNRQVKDVEMENWIAEIKLRALRRMGEIIKGLETNEARFRRPSGGKPTKTSILKQAGVSKSVAHRAEIV